MPDPTNDPQPGEKIAPTMIPPVQALVISGTGTGPGGTVQKVIQTPDGQPNIVI